MLMFMRVERMMSLKRTTNIVECVCCGAIVVVFVVVVCALITSSGLPEIRWFAPPPPPLPLSTCDALSLLGPRSVQAFTS